MSSCKKDIAAQKVNRCSVLQLLQATRVSGHDGQGGTKGLGIDQTSSADYSALAFFGSLGSVY